jgi:hypothetical protein
MPCLRVSPLCVAPPSPCRAARSDPLRTAPGTLHHTSCRTASRRAASFSPRVSLLPHRAATTAKSRRRPALAAPPPPVWHFAEHLGRDPFPLILSGATLRTTCSQDRLRHKGSRGRQDERTPEEFREQIWTSSQPPGSRLGYDPT